MRFVDPGYLFLLISLPVFLGLYLLSRSMQKKLELRFASSDMLPRIAPSISSFYFWVRCLLTLSALGLSIIALSRPQFGTRMKVVQRKGLDLVVALDVSKSMMAEDYKPNRLEKAKFDILALIDRLKGDRIGVVVFAGRAFVQVPLTLDYDAAKMLVRRIQTDLVQQQGTELTQAVERTRELFLQGNREEDKGEKNRLVVLFSDGEDHEELSDLKSLAKKSSEDGLIFYTVGLGSSKVGVPIPIYRKGIRSGFFKAASGRTVVTKMDPISLQSLASVTGGKFFRSTFDNSTLNALIKELSKYHRTKLRSRKWTAFEDRFQWLLWPALIILLLEMGMYIRRKTDVAE